MAETRYQDLSADDMRDALEVAERGSSYKAHLLEKDVWVVVTLGALFDAPFAQHLTFKGGTSLSKVWRAIRRFSEDIDITYDIRAIAPDLVGDVGDEALPATRSQEKRWTRAIRERLAEWVRDRARPTVEEGLAQAGFAARVRAEADRLHIGYEPLFQESGFVRPEVMVEFGARSTGEPHGVRPVVCDATAYLSDLEFPEARPTVMLAERTFWEKATAIHVYCRQERRRGERLSRHWHDLARLDEAGIGAVALADRAVALSVARHKAMFFPENDARGERIDYGLAVSGALQLIPTGTAHVVLADDYARMLADGMLLDDSESFDRLMERCAQIEVRANETKA
ncbi:MAG: nucleotidyl transferase AbiEii/AbiGii toxin family protein [Gammaproteobacteria bacterium]|nr:nucleotidyl transferase AbiEii/AbiGii toxin family protein [Gammaproteobacteria bacterium]